MPRYYGGAFWPYALAHQPGGWAEQSKSFPAPTWPLSLAIVLIVSNQLSVWVTETETGGCMSSSGTIYFFMLRSPFPASVSGPPPPVLGPREIMLLMPCLTV